MNMSKNKNINNLNNEEYWQVKRSPYDSKERCITDYLLNRASADLPHSFNLLDKCPKEIRDQKTQGICGAFATATLREMHLKDANIQLSPAFLYWQARAYHNQTDEDCGVYLRDMVRVLQEFGIPEEKYMIYNSENYSVPPSKEAYNNARMYKINHYCRMDNGVSGIKSYLYTKKKPVLFGMEVYKGFIKETGKKGIAPVPSEEEKPIDGHAALLVGYKDNTLKDDLISVFNHKRSKYGYFIVLNSYGKHWGKRGFFLLPYEILLMNKAYDFYVITTNNQDYENEVILKK